MLTGELMQAGAQLFVMTPILNISAGQQMELPITCYDLWDSEEAGCIKFDMLTVVAADKIHKTMDLLIEHGKITWEGR